MPISTINTNSLGANAVTTSKIASGVTITNPTVSGTVTGLNSASMPTGSVLQVVSAYSDTQTTTTSTTYVTANLSASITPSSSSNKILILVNTTVQVGSSGDMNATIFRGTVSGTNLAAAAATQGLFYSTATGGSSTGYTGAMMQFLDSPNTTSSTTYTVGFRTSGITAVMQKGQTYGTITLMEIKG
jgi:hypothetical protein